MRPEKEAMLAELTARVSESVFVILTDIGTMDVSTDRALRACLRSVDAEVHVVKNRIFGHLTKQIGVEKLREGLTGRTAVVTGRGEVTDVAKALTAFVEERKLPVIKMGAFEGVFLSPQDIEAIATLPSKDVMRAQLLGTLAAPMSQTVGVLSQKLSSLLYVLKAAEAKKSEQAA